jgi:site-specific recombinase XerD
LENKIITTNRSTPEWDDAVAAFESDQLRRGRSDETIRAYRATLIQFAKFYKESLEKKGPYLSRIQKTDVYAFIEYLRSTRYLAVSSINRAVAALHSFSRFLIEQHWHRRDIAKGLRTYYVEDVYEPERLSEKEIRRLVTSVNINGVNGYRDQAILQLLLQCGIRLNELVRLAVHDVAIGKTSGNIKIRDEKARSERKVPLNASARNALQAYLYMRGDLSSSDPLFFSTHGKRISPKTIQYLIKKYLCAVGRPDLSVGDLRHHFALSLYDRNKNLAIVQRALGHRNLATTARYIKSTHEELAGAIESLPDNVYHDQSLREMVE